MNKTYSVYKLAGCFSLLIIAFFLILIAGLRPIGFDRDSLNYLDSFDNFTSLFESDYSDREPTFWLIVWVSNFISDGEARIFFVIYAALGVLISLFSIKNITCHPLLATFCYIFLFFPLHGMTQIRAGVAGAIFLLLIPDIVEKKLGSFILKSVLAVMFHYSAVVVFVLYFLNPKKINIRFYLLLPLIGLLSVLFNSQFVVALGSMVPFFPDLIGSRLLIYIDLLRDGIGENINLFSIYYSGILVIYYYAILNIKKFDGKYDYILIKILGWALFAYYFGSFLPAIAVRVSELYGLVIIFIIPMLAYSFKENIFYLSIFNIFVFVFVLLIFINNVFVHSLFYF